MSFLSWLGFNKMVEDTNKVLEFPKVPPMPQVAPPKKVEVSKEHYRIGYDNQRDMVTLTMLDEYNRAMTTLSMNKSASEQLIRMLRAAFPKQQELQDD